MYVCMYVFCVSVCVCMHVCFVQVCLLSVCLTNIQSSILFIQYILHIPSEETKHHPQNNFQKGKKGKKTYATKGHYSGLWTTRIPESEEGLQWSAKQVSPWFCASLDPIWSLLCFICFCVVLSWFVFLFCEIFFVLFFVCYIVLACFFVRFSLSVFLMALVYRIRCCAFFSCLLIILFRIFSLFLILEFVSLTSLGLYFQPNAFFRSIR